MPTELQNMEVNMGVSPVKRKYDNEVETPFTPILKFAKMTEHAFTPTRGSELAAGYDLYR